MNAAANEYLATIRDAETNMKAIVFASNHKAGGFGVALIDEDAAETVVSFHGFQTIAAAIVKAKAIL